MSGSNALQITDPNASNALAQAPSWADAYGNITGSTQNPISDLQTWLAAQRAKSAKMGLWDDMTGLPTGAGLVNAAQQTSNALLMGTTAPGIRAFHGSPYDFERFDTSKIGTGEGEQAYGHGLYMAGNENVAQTYKPGGGGHMYQVNIGADPQHFLDWDKPISEQSQHVQDTLDQTGIARQENQPHVTGSDVHDFLSNGEADPAAAARKLQAAGIPGIKYLDQGSRGSGEGTHNYVVFDANTINILRKYGIAGLIAGGGAAAAGSQQQPPMAQ